VCRSEWLCGDVGAYRGRSRPVLIDRMKDQDLFVHVNLVKGERSALAELASTLL